MFSHPYMKIGFFFIIIITAAITKNNYNNIFIVLGALKSLACFPLDINVNRNSWFKTNQVLCKFCKQEISNKQDCWSKCIVILKFYEITIICDSQLRTQLIFQYPKKMLIPRNEKKNFSLRLNVKLLQSSVKKIIPSHFLV